jgi:hypothetical protein
MERPQECCQGGKGGAAKAGRGMIHPRSGHHGHRLRGEKQTQSTCGICGATHLGVRQRKVVQGQVCQQRLESATG